MNNMLLRAKCALVEMVLAVCVVFPHHAEAISFDVENTNFFSSSMTVQSIVPTSTGYRMYLADGSFKIYSATSTDQVNWFWESGTRLSRSGSWLDTSSITSCGVYLSTNPADPMRMFYVGISYNGRYRILSATSNDGLTWTKETSTHVIKNNGSGFLDSPRPFSESDGLIRLYYIADSAGGKTQSNYRIFTASSSDGGKTFIDDGTLLGSDIAYQVSITTLTDGRTRLYYSAPLTGETTGTQVLSAIAESGSQSFTLENGVRQSTGSSSAEISYPVVIRSTENFRWRNFYSLRIAGTTTPYVTSAITSSPTLVSFTPTTVQSDETLVSFTLTGEIFSSTVPTISFIASGDAISPMTVVREDDLTVTGTFNALGRKVGPWVVSLTNPDSATAQMSAFTMKAAPAKISVIDNLFRPNAGGQASISIQTFASGEILMQIYSQSGSLITTLMNEHRPIGTYTATWNGRTPAGNVTASGVYFLRIIGPGADIIRKIVVIK